MSPTLFHVLAWGVAALVSRVTATTTTNATNTTLPCEVITPDTAIQVTAFGERPAWHPNGTKLAFLHKSYGDVLEYDLISREITSVTAFRHYGINRVHYLPNGDYFLTGAAYDVPNTITLRNEELHMFILPQGGGSARPINLNQKIFEGIAVSRKQMKISWANYHWQYKDEIPDGETRIYVADIHYNETGYPSIINKKELAKFHRPDCMAETQDFYNNDTMVTVCCYTILNEGTANARVDRGSLWGVNIETGETTLYRASNDELGQSRFNEYQGNWPTAPYSTFQTEFGQNLEVGPEGGQNHKDDIWRIRLEPNTTDIKRLTYFGMKPGQKAGNPVISPDSRWMAFQGGRTGAAVGTGFGLYIQALEPVSEEW